MRAKASLLLGQILIAVAFLSTWQVLVTTGKLDKFFFSRPERYRGAHRDVARDGIHLAASCSSRWKKPRWHSR